MWMLAQVADDFADVPIHPMGNAGLAGYSILGLSITSILYFSFWIWMLIHCVRTEPDRSTWLWIIVFFQGIGPLIYFLLRYLPSTELKPPKFLRNLTRGRELARLETAAAQIGNAHQYVKYGDVLRDVGKYEEAAKAYDQAIEKDPGNLQALWGAAQVAAIQKSFTRARDLTKQILEQDARYKFGDVSLMHGKSLLELNARDEAMAHFEQHVPQWRHPEAVYLLANLYFEKGNNEAARVQLQAVLHDISGSPAAIARRHGRWKSRARQLLRKVAAT